MSGIIVLALRLILAACLYAFLGWALSHLWKDLRAQGINLAGRKAPTLSLTLQRAGEETTRRAFQQSDISIGRDPACDIPLNDDAISARHVHLSYPSWTVVGGRPRLHQRHALKSVPARHPHRHHYRRPDRMWTHRHHRQHRRDSRPFAHPAPLTCPENFHARLDRIHINRNTGYHRRLRPLHHARPHRDART